MPTERHPLPPGPALEGLAPPVAAQFHRLARTVLLRRLMPCVWRHCAQRSREQLVKSRDQLYTPDVVVNVFRQSELFSGWPESALKELAKKRQIRVYRRGDIVIHAGEPCAPAALFLVYGSCERLRSLNDLVQRGREQRGGALATASSTTSAQARPALVDLRLKGLSGFSSPGTVLKAPCRLTGFSAANQERYDAPVVCTDEVCDILAIPREAFSPIFASFAPQLQQPVLKAIMARREENVLIQHPLTEALIRRAALFRELTASVISFVISRSRARCHMAGSVIWAAGNVPKELLFIRRGMVAIVDQFGEKKAVYRPGACLGEKEYFFEQPVQHCVIALSNVDVYVMKTSDVKANTACREALDSAAGDQHEQDLAAMRLPAARSPTALQMAGYVTNAPPPPDQLTLAVQTLPLFSFFATQDAVQDLRALLRPKVVGKGSLIVSTADQCDRIIFMTQGTAIVRGGASQKIQMFQIGEAIGYTCLVHHRWVRPVVANSPVDLWEVPRVEFIGVLKKHGIYRRVLGATIQLLQPLLQNPRRVPLLEAYVLKLPKPNTLPGLKTPNLHPTSFDAAVLQFAPWRPAGIPDALTGRVTEPVDDEEDFDLMSEPESQPLTHRGSHSPSMHSHAGAPNATGTATSGGGASTSRRSTSARRLKKVSAHVKKAQQRRARSATTVRGTQLTQLGTVDSNYALAAAAGVKININALTKPQKKSFDAVSAALSATKTPGAASSTAAIGAGGTGNAQSLTSPQKVSGGTTPLPIPGDEDVIEAPRPPRRDAAKFTLPPGAV